MGNNNTATRNGVSPTTPLSKAKDYSESQESDYVELHNTNDLRKMGKRRNLEIIQGILQGSMDREEGLGRLAILPDECILHVVSFLSIADLVCMSCVSKILFFLGRDDSLWKLIYKRSMQPYFHEALFNEQHMAYAYTFDSRGKQKRKMRRCGKWRSICARNLLRLPNGEPMIISEHILGWSLERVNDLFGSSDEITTVGRTGAYHYYHCVGLAVCIGIFPPSPLANNLVIKGGTTTCIVVMFQHLNLVCTEDDKVTGVLKNTPLESCSGPAYVKIIPYH